MADEPAPTPSSQRSQRSRTPRVRVVSGYVGVVDYLRREIALGRLLPGERLPAERKLADELGVARETLRQALRVLEGSGQIAVTRGAGGAVILDHALGADYVRNELLARRDTLISLVEYRAELESSSARLAAGRRADDDLASMREAQDALSDARNKDESRRADTAFHLAVAEAAGNEHLAAAIEDARAEMFYPVDLANFDFIKESSRTQHQAVLDAVAAGDASRAAAAMRAHIEHTREEMLTLIS